MSSLGGRLSYREDPNGRTGVCLTYEFEERDCAEAAARALREQGEHVEGPCDYGSDED